MPQVLPDGGSNLASSRSEHSTFRPPSIVDTTPVTQYVKGETRYMKIQKRGICEGVLQNAIEEQTHERKEGDDAGGGFGIRQCCHGHGGKR